MNPIFDAVGQPLELGDFVAAAGPGKHLIQGVITEVNADINLVKIKYFTVIRRWRYEPGIGVHYVPKTNKRAAMVDRRSLIKFDPSQQTRFHLMHPWWVLDAPNLAFRTETEVAMTKFLFDLHTEMKQKLHEQNKKANT